MARVILANEAASFFVENSSELYYSTGKPQQVTRMPTVYHVSCPYFCQICGTKYTFPLAKPPPLPSLGAVLSRPMDLDTATSLQLPDWPVEGTDSTLRDSELEHPSIPTPTSLGVQRGFGGSPSISQPMPGIASGGVTPLGTPPVHGGVGTSKAAGGKWTDLDAFYADAEEDSESESEEEDESGDEEGESEEDESEGNKKGMEATKTAAAVETVSPDPEESEEEEEDSSEGEESDDQPSDEAAHLVASPWGDR